MKIESLAGVLVTCQASDTAVRLWGATSVVREAQCWPLHPVAHADYDQDVAVTRAQLGEAAFAAVWAEG